MSPSTSSIPGRILSLLAGILYLGIVSSILMAAAPEAPEIGFFQAVVATGLIIICIILLNRNLHLAKYSKQRLGISSLFWVLIPVAVYIALIHQSIKLVGSFENMTMYYGSLTLFYGTFFGVVSTFILIRVADAIMWIASGVARMWRRLRQTRP